MTDTLLWRLRTQCKKIFIRDLSLDCSIGVYDEEHQQRQPVIFNCEVWLLNQSASSPDDQLEDVLDYTSIIEIIRSEALSGHTGLQETLVDSIADAIVQLPQIVMLHLSTEKPQAYRQARGVGVEVWRQGKAFNQLS